MTMFEEFETKQFGQWCEAIESVGQVRAYADLSSAGMFY